MTDRQKDSNTLYICPGIQGCNSIGCEHRVPHTHRDNCHYSCDGECERVDDPKWSALREELQDLQEKGVRTIDPVLVLRFMDYIEQAAEAAQ